MHYPLHPLGVYRALAQTAVILRSTYRTCFDLCRVRGTGMYTPAKPATTYEERYCFAVLMSCTWVMSFSALRSTRSPRNSIQTTLGLS